MTNDNNLNDYIQIKFIQFILHNDSVFKVIFKDHLFDDSILNIAFAVTFASYLKVFMEETKFLNSKVKDKAYRIIDYIKENNNFIDEEKHRINYLFNDVIMSLNVIQDIDCEEYYLDEIAKRFDFKKNVTLNEEEYEDYKSIVEESLGNDYIILSYHCELIKENDFEESVPLFTTDMYYFNSLNAILNEYPEILRNETFKRRVKKVIGLNKKSEINKSSHTQLEKKFIQRNTNYFNKLLKKV